MCGITGIVDYQSGVIDPAQLEAMCDALYHRGPDSGGTYIDRGDRLAVGLGSRRLSIIDLSDAGRMPMTNEDGALWLVYNGELYNHHALRRYLVDTGHVYQSDTDTETIIHAYEEYGVDCLSRFNGMFAFALYDRARQRLFIARDQMGIKPLYYAWNGKRLIFASELRALFIGLECTPDLDPAALSLYFSLGYVPAPYTMYRGVNKLPPGSYLLLEAGKLTHAYYWKPEYASAEEDDTAELIQRLRDAFTGAVTRQLMSDVPVGVFLSGGLDSSLVAVLAQRMRTTPMDTFSVGFAGPNGHPDTASAFNQDMHFARQVAAQIGTRHHEIVVPMGENIIELLHSTLAHLDEPLWETSFTSLHLMSRLARQHGVIVILTGDGSDELFAGYPWHGASLRLRTFDRIPLLKYALPLLSLIAGEHPLGVKARDLRRKLGQDSLTRYRLTHNIFSHEEKTRLFAPELLAGLEGDPVDDVIAPVLAQAAGDFPDQLIMADLSLWVREHFNQRVDRMSMMHSVEARVPFQDMEVVKLALRIPLSTKVRNGTGKYLLRAAFADVIPRIVMDRPKRPFSTPTELWLSGPLRQYTHKMLSRAGDSGLLNADMVQAVLNQFMAGDERLVYKVWALLNFQIWAETHRAKETVWQS